MFKKNNTKIKKLSFYAGFLVLLISYSIIDSKENSKEKKGNSQEEIIDPNEIIDESENSKRDKTVNTIIESFEFGTPDEVKNSLAIFRRLKNQEDIDKIKPHLIKLLDPKNMETSRALIITLMDKKIFDFNEKIISIINTENKLENSVLLNDIFNLMALSKEKKSEDKLIELLLKKDLSINDNQTLTIMSTLTKIESSKFAEFIHNTLELEFKEILPQKENQGNKEISKENKIQLLWNKKENQKIESSILENMILSIGELKFTHSSEMLFHILKSAFKDADLNHEIFKETKEIRLEATIQGYIVNAIGNLEYGKAVDLLKYKLEKYNTLNEEDKKKYFYLQMQIISALSKLKDPSGEKILIESLKDNNPVVRQRSAKLLAQVRSEESVKLLSYRALRDSNPKVGFECLSTLMEIIQPGITSNGKINGNLPSSSAQTQAVDGIVMYLDPEKNPLAHLHWLKYMAELLKNDTIDNKIIDFIEKKINSFLAKERQSHAVSILTAIIEKHYKEKKIIHNGAESLLKKISANKELRYAAQMANRSLKYIETFK